MAPSLATATFHVEKYDMDTNRPGLTQMFIDLLYLLSYK